MSELEEKVDEFSRFVIPMENIVFDLPDWTSYDE